jgi:hypothetical protein
MKTYLSFHKSTIHSVLSVQELNDITIRIPDCPIIPNLQILHRLDQPPLDITSLSSLDGSINQTLSTSHSVEPELLRRQSS